MYLPWRATAWPIFTGSDLAYVPVPAFCYSYDGSICFKLYEIDISVGVASLCFDSSFYFLTESVADGWFLNCFGIIGAL